MLKQLYIQDFTIIDKLDINFDHGFSVITGETGAGKSIIIGALGLLLGNRADIKCIRNGAERCIIEAHFDLCRYNLQSFFEQYDIDYDENDCIIRREVTNKGKSRAFINDTPIPLSTMKELGDLLIDIHSQHQNLLINNEDFQMNVIDIIACDQDIVKDYQDTYSMYCEEKKSFEINKERIDKSRENEDYLRYQYSELDKANLQEGEQKDIEEEIETLSHMEEIKSTIYFLDENLSSDDNGIIERVQSMSNKLNEIKDIYHDVDDLASRLDSCYIELKDISHEIGVKLEHIDFDPGRLDILNERLDLINNLEHKHHVDSDKELISLRDSIASQISSIDNSDEEIKTLEEKVEKLRLSCVSKATQLTKERIKAAKYVEKSMRDSLIPLGIPNVRFEVSISEKPISYNGADKISFLFSANAGSTMQPISSIASGGEIARVMLSLKSMISKTVKLPTIIFDEIDTGVSGRIAEKMANIMYEMGKDGRQVITITHLPQIAALGTKHYKVMKKENATATISTMSLLTEKERIEEIAQMLSGDNVTSAAIENAKVLLKIKG